MIGETPSRICSRHRSTGRPRFWQIIATTCAGPVADTLRHVPHVDLADDPYTVDAIAAALEAATTLRRRARHTIADAAQGNFVYATLAAHSRDLTTKPPAELSALYEHVLGGPDSVAADVLGVVCQGRDDGLSPSRIADILQADRTAIDSALESCGRVLLVGKFAKPHHRCLVDYAKSLSRPGSGRIAAYAVKRWGGRWEKCSEVYALRNVIPHLADAAFTEWSGNMLGGSGGAATNLRDTLADPAYLTAALAAVGVDELRAALSYARHRIAGTAADVDMMATLSSILHGEARALREFRSATDATRQLMYLAATRGAVELARGLARQSGKGEVQTLWATDDLMTRGAPRAIRGHTAQVIAVNVAASGTQAVSAALDGTALVWHLASGRLANSLRAPAPVAVDRSGPTPTRC